MSDIPGPNILFLQYTIKTKQENVAMLHKNKTVAATHIRRPISATSARPRRCMSDGERMCEDGSCIARVELCPEEQLMNQNTILIMIIVGLAVVVFLAILYCFQKRQQQANRQLGADSGLSEECDNESLYAPPPAYEEVVNSNMYPATPEQRRLRQLSLDEPRSPMTPPPNYASALIILAQSEESISSKQHSQSDLIRRSVSLDQIQDAAPESSRDSSDSSWKRKYSKTRNIFRFSRQFSKTSGNNSLRASESPKTPRSPPPYPQSPLIYPQTPPPPLTPLPNENECAVQEQGTDSDIVT
ncbi:uncharacterized protein LOC123548712 [Mercenaria mercenaria]|uniref:uncharacterized protein LOC123548712 n=1 Tax=Mercenaria mercenaria TaxID=6596 RepID=UPI001E1DF38F|nr:uncharacterized protein LOC123548712 [Mercenaria mercenaria]XP_053402070.1 uncharacterized protein LOC123548712 [Mercenaria mercenaria]XP_053402071.1 uncharacterized protein LOC123548712 [Mercenaria mercenaria]